MKVNVIKLQELLTLDVTLVAVTKYFSKEITKDLIDLGVKNIGESKVDDLMKKLDILKDVKIHFIGHLQRNKAKKIINEISCLHSLDSLALAKLINQERIKPLDCFIQVNLDEGKPYGVSLSLLDNFISNLKLYDKINVLGLMGISHNTDDDLLIENDFRKLKELNDYYGFKNLSIGMSNDYLIALKNQATHIRIGSILVEE